MYNQTCHQHNHNPSSIVNIETSKYDVVRDCTQKTDFYEDASKTFDSQQQRQQQNNFDYRQHHKNSDDENL